MIVEETPSLLTKLLSLAFFSALTVLSFAWFFYSVLSLISQVNLDGTVIAFDKGSMYMLGIGMALLSLTIGGLIHGVLAKALTPKAETIFKYSVIASIVVMIALPQITHHFIDSYVRNKNYISCNEATYQWLLYSKYYYSDSQINCDKLVQEKEITKSSSGR